MTNVTIVTNVIVVTNVTILTTVRMVTIVTVVINIEGNIRFILKHPGVIFPGLYNNFVRVVIEMVYKLHIKRLLP